MDCLFNRFIPKPTDSTMVLRPGSKTYINGMCDNYQGKYNEEKLKGLMTRNDFEGIIDAINDSLVHEYPCPGC
jgi:hypothetical protein